MVVSFFSVQRLDIACPSMWVAVGGPSGPTGDLLGATFGGGTRKSILFYTGNLHYSVLQSFYRFIVWLH